jgi:hypothetical protein
MQDRDEVALKEVEANWVFVFPSRFKVCGRPTKKDGSDTVGLPK